MLSKKERLSREEFNRFFSAGRRFHSPSFTLVYVQDEGFHVAVVIAKKVAQGAVDRNKLRRRVYETARVYRQEVPRTGVYIFIAKSNAQNHSYQELKDEVRSLINQTIKVG